MLDFRPPIDNPFFVATAKFLFPLVKQFRLLGADIQIQGDGLKRFNQLKGKRTVICPNHSHRNDPEVMLYLSMQAYENFNYICAREVFDWNFGLNGWIFQNLGVYSVVRGAADRESFKKTKEIIVAGKNKLVLFPEGEISRQNDSLLPLESGAVQLAFWALDELQKTKANEPVYILPIALKYTFPHNITNILIDRINKIEKHLGIKCGDNISLYQRVRNAGIKVVRVLEDGYNIKAKPDDSLNERLNGLRAAVLRKMADILGVELPNSGSHLDCVRLLRNKLDDFIYGDINELSGYEKEIHEKKTERMRDFYRDLDRIVTYIAIYDGYLHPPTTQERLVNVIELLETEIFNKISDKGKRLILLDIGKPINLLEIYPEYKKNKRALLTSATQDMTDQLHNMLETMDKERNPVYVS